MALQPVPFGRYRLLNLLGEGGMAKVYRALLSGPMGFEKEVALKRIDQKLTEDERVVKALINEARLGGQLRHKNIVEIYEFNQVDGNYFMAMEYVDGWTLDGVLRGCRTNQQHLPASVIVEILIHVCRGLEYAHGLVSKDGQPANLVHRDLKPGNLIVSREGDVKIMDFGIAKADSNLYKTTAADVTKGTPIYMSPEQVTGGKLDKRSDLFSLGSIIHEMVTLQVPFFGDNLLAIMHAILNAEIDEARDRVKKRVPALEPILARCMARVKEERYDSAKDLEVALRGVRRELPPGPTLAEWVEDFAASLPAATATGEFGPDGAPVSLHGKPAEGTQSLAALGTQEGPTADASAGPLVVVDSEEPFDSFAATVAVSTDPDATLGREEQAFFNTDGGPLPDDVKRTRIQKSVPAQQTPRAPAKRKKKKKKSSGPLWAAVMFLVVILGVAVLVAVKTLSDPEPAPVVDEPETQAPVQVVEDPALPDLSEPVTEAATPAPRAKTERATPRPREPVTPRAKAKDKPPREPATPRAKHGTPEAATPAPVAELTPAPPAEVGRGTVSLNSKPWSTVIVDGSVVGTTPIQNHELSAGAHTVVFDCSACTPPEKRKMSFTVQAGQSTKKIVRFGE